MIQFVLMVNRQGQTRLAKYGNFVPLSHRTPLEGEVVRKCFQRKEDECSIVAHLNYTLVFQRYGPLYVVVGTDNEDSRDSKGRNDNMVNELAIMEFIHALVDTLNQYFDDKVSELDIIFNQDKVHMIVEDMMASGCVIGTNKEDTLRFLKQTEEHPLL
eukprot:TRINITY_DN51573_c0_g1_i1.p2 TRINITY_DN51573_c0_g1~~TRINITY_DN51573_c0_g1_i1.p2  ORF type:complete len:158 (+),score=68.17 TRINITY_DN51573_c0_g1_i1:78-551(+)